ncbi:MAG: hypothetical protein EA351_07300 [Gemmatimonadales bacterium]|nr:MAG: hypothetical protein EA351_07300 [Gemmatimonadales bacterium]
MTLRKSDARFPVRGLADLSHRPSPGGLTPLGRVVWSATLLVVFAFGGWRWHEAAVHRPVQVLDAGVPAAVVVVQEGDCPDRRAALEHWLVRMRSETGADQGLILRRVVLSGPEPDEATELSAIQPLGGAEADRVVRALRRSPERRTPVLLVLDASGHTLLSFGFEAWGPGARLEHSARLLGLLSNPGAGSGGPDAPVEREGTVWRR